MTIKEALSKLDHQDDSHWTRDGLPRMNVVEALIGDKSITRKDVNAAIPKFHRHGMSEAEKWAKMYGGPKKAEVKGPCGHIFEGKCQLNGRVMDEGTCNCSQRK